MRLIEHRFEDFYELPNDYIEFFRLGYIKNANRTLRPQFENLDTLRFFLEQYIKNNDHGFGIAIDNENAAALKNRNSGEINNKNFNASLLHLINQQDISNLPIFNDFFDQICEGWLW